MKQLHVDLKMVLPESDLPFDSSFHKHFQAPLYTLLYARQRSLIYNLGMVRD